MNIVFHKKGEMGMKCSMCGMEINEKAKFCSNCGAKLEETQTVLEVQNNTVVHSNSNNKNQEPNGLSITALILGIAAVPSVFINILLGMICSILAIVFGAIGRKKGAKSLGTAGMILGIVSAAIVVFMILLTVLMVFSFFDYCL